MTPSDLDAAARAARDQNADAYFSRDKHPLDKPEPISSYYAGWSAGAAWAAGQKPSKVFMAEHPFKVSEERDKLKAQLAEFDIGALERREAREAALRARAETAESVLEKVYRHNDLADSARYAFKVILENERDQLKAEVERLKIQIESLQASFKQTERALHAYRLQCEKLAGALNLPNKILPLWKNGKPEVNQKNLDTILAFFEDWSMAALAALTEFEAFKKGLADDST